jgi:uncharacterized protein with HEPN domain
MKDDMVYLRHILDAISAVESFTAEGERDAKTFSAVERQLEIIGEAANKLSPLLRQTYTEVEWKEIIGMRNILIHEYFGVQPSMVWQVVEQDIEPLKKSVQSIVLTLNNQTP